MRYNWDKVYANFNVQVTGLKFAYFMLLPPFCDFRCFQMVTNIR